MSVWEHSRFRIFNPSQHPFSHSVEDLAYVNPRVPMVSRLGETLDYIIAVLYPNYVGTVATPADLPAVATANDYIIVEDDGDGNSAGYIYQKLDNVSQWIKRYDMDWSTEGLLAETINRTNALYVHKYGMDDRDASGNVIAGETAGQVIFGGASANTSLTLKANSGDEDGSHTGFVQVDDSVRPLEDNAYTLGTSAKRWSDIQAAIANIADIAINTGSITSASPDISLGANNLVTTGNASVSQLDASVQAEIANVTISSGSIVSGSGALDFAANTLSTTGAVSTGAITVESGLVINQDGLSAVDGTIAFNGGDLNQINSVEVTTSVTAQSAAIGGVDISGSVISIDAAAASQDLTLQAGAASQIILSSPVSGSDATLTGRIEANDAGIGDLELATNVISNASGAIVLSPSTTVTTQADLVPSSDGLLDLGGSGAAFDKLWLSGAIGGATAITVTDLVTLRSAPYRNTARTLPAQDGDTLFWNQAAQQWIASHPDTEILHSEVTGLTSGDAGHTQFAMLAGRAGGQTISGGTLATENLLLQPNAAGSGGQVKVSTKLTPSADSTYDGGLAKMVGIDLGVGSARFADVYTAGEFIGLRVQNVLSTGIPVMSAPDIGRIVYQTDKNKLSVNTGSAWRVISASKVEIDQAFDGISTTVNIDVSAYLVDARKAVWQLLDSANDYERMWVSVKATSATNVRVTTNVALPAGTYRLVGIE